VFSALCFRQSQLAKMTSDLCEDGGDQQREKEAPAASKASSVSPRSLEPPGPWNDPPSPVTPERTASSTPFAALQEARLTLVSRQEAEMNYRTLRSPPGFSCSFRRWRTSGDHVTDWLRLLLEGDGGPGELTGRVPIGTSVRPNPFKGAFSVIAVCDALLADL